MEELVEVHLVEREGRKLCFFPGLKLLCEPDRRQWERLRAYVEDPRGSADAGFQDVRDLYRDLQRQFSGRQLWWHTEVSGLTLIVATDCNMRCSYCYAGQGSYGRTRELMTMDVAEEAVRKVFAHFPHVRQVRFFGGEPFLNADVIRGVCGLITEDLGLRHISFAVETNGTLITDEIVSMVKEYSIDLGVSLDGPSSVHDYHRVFRDGTGSHDLVVANLERLREGGVRFAVVCTYTEKHRPMVMGELRAYLRHISPYYQISPCMSHDLTTVVPISREDRLAGLRSAGDKDVGYELQPLQQLSSVFSDALPEHFCDAQSRLTVFPDGSVFPCELLCEDDFYMGNVRMHDFPSSDFNRSRKALVRFRRSGIPRRYWFRYLVYPLCIAEYKSVRHMADIRFEETSGEFYEDLLLVAGELATDETRHARLTEAIQHIQAMRGQE